MVRKNQFIVYNLYILIYIGFNVLKGHVWLYL
jgi:hypothetical protein